MLVTIFDTEQLNVYQRSSRKIFNQIQSCLVNNWNELFGWRRAHAAAEAKATRETVLLPTTAPSQGTEK